MSEQDTTISQIDSMTVSQTTKCPFCGNIEADEVYDDRELVEAVCVECDSMMYLFMLKKTEGGRSDAIYLLNNWFRQEIDNGNVEAKAFWSKYLPLSDQTDN